MRVHKPIFISIIAVIALLAAASTAFAVAPSGFGVYYSYGGFEPVEMAFERVQSLMNFSRSGAVFSSSGYLMMVAAFMILSCIMAAASGFTKMATGQQSTIFVSLAPIILGFVVFVGLFTPKTDLIVYDPVLNKQSQATMQLPIGVVYPAVMINHIERFVIEIFDSTSISTVINYTDRSGTPQQRTIPSLNYSEYGGGVGFDVYSNSMSDYAASTAASKSMYNFIKDCAVFEMSQPGGTLKQADLISPPVDKTLMDVLGDAQSGANWTTSFLPMGGVDPGPAGRVDSCSAAYTVLYEYYVTNASTNTLAALNNACAERGFDASSFGQCQMLMEQVMSTSLAPSLSDGSTVMPANFVGNMSVANITADYMASASPQASAQFQALQQSAVQGSVMGAISGVVNPRMIDAWVAYSFFLIPLLAMFIPTPLCQKTLMLMLSLVLWNMLVRCLDVITFHMWMAEYNKAIAGMGDIGQGIASYFRLPMEAGKHLKSFADLRSSVFLLATAISGALFKFGDSAMSRLADRASSEHTTLPAQVVDQGARTQAQMQTLTGAHRAMIMAAIAGGTHGANNLAHGAAYNEFSPALAGQGALSTAGGDAGTLAAQVKQKSAVDTITSVSEAMKMSNPDAHARGGMNADRAMGGVRAEKAMFDTLNNAGLLAAGTTMRDFQQQRQQSAGGVALADGTKLTMTQGADGTWQATSESQGKGYTAAATYANGHMETAQLANGQAWTATFGRDGTLLASNNRALSGSLNESVNAKFSQNAADMWSRMSNYDVTKGSQTEHANASQYTREKMESFAKEIASGQAEKLVRSGAIQQSEKAGVERALSARLAGDGVLLATLAGGAIGGPAGMASGAVAGAAAKLAGVSAEVAGQYTKKSSTDTTATQGLNHGNEQSLQNMLKESMVETSKNSKTISDIKKDSLSSSFSSSNGLNQNFSSVVGYDQTKGFTARAEMETGFIKEYSEQAKFQHIAPMERVAAANNEIAGMKREDAGALFAQFLERKAMADGDIAGRKEAVEGQKVELKKSYKDAEREVGEKVVVGQANVTGPGRGPVFGLKDEVRTAAAEKGANVAAGGTYVAATPDKISMFNSNMPTADGFRVSEHPSPSIPLGSTQLGATGGQPMPPLSDVQRAVNSLASAPGAITSMLATPFQILGGAVANTAGDDARQLHRDMQNSFNSGATNITSPGKPAETAKPSGPGQEPQAKTSDKTASPAPSGQGAPAKFATTAPAATPKTEKQPETGKPAETGKPSGVAQELQPKTSVKTGAPAPTGKRVAPVKFDSTAPAATPKTEKQTESGKTAEPVKTSGSVPPQAQGAPSPEGSKSTTQPSTEAAPFNLNNAATIGTGSPQSPSRAADSPTVSKPPRNDSVRPISTPKPRPPEQTTPVTPAQSGPAFAQQSSPVQSQQERVAVQAPAQSIPAPQVKTVQNEQRSQRPAGSNSTPRTAAAPNKPTSVQAPSLKPSQASTPKPTSDGRSNKGRA